MRARRGSGKFVLQTLDFVDDADEFFAEGREGVFDARWDFGERAFFEDAEADELVEAFAEDFGGEAICAAFDGAGAIDAFADAGEHVERPLAADDGLDHVRDAWVRDGWMGGGGILRGLWKFF